MDSSTGILHLISSIHLLKKNRGGGYQALRFVFFGRTTHWSGTFCSFGWILVGRGPYRSTTVNICTSWLEEEEEDEDEDETIYSIDFALTGIRYLEYEFERNDLPQTEWNLLLGYAIPRPLAKLEYWFRYMRC